MMRLYFNLKNQIKILKGDYTFISAGKKILKPRKYTTQKLQAFPETDAHKQ